MENLGRTTDTLFLRDIKNQGTIFVAISFYSSNVSLVSLGVGTDSDTLRTRNTFRAGYQILLTIRDPIFRRRYATYTPRSTFVAPRQMIRMRRSFRLASAWQSRDLQAVRCTVYSGWPVNRSFGKVWGQTTWNSRLVPPPTTPAAKIQRVSDHTLRLRNIAAISLTNGSLGTINVALFKSIATLGWRENAFSWTRPSVDRLFLSQADAIGKCYFSRTVTRQSNNLKSLLQCKIENLKRRTTIYAEILSLRRETFNYTPKCEVQSSQLNFWKIFDEWIGEVGIILRWSIGQDFLEFLSRLEDLWWDVTRLQLKVVRLQPALPVEISGQLRTRESDCSFWSKRCLTSKLHAYCIH